MVLDLGRLPPEVRLLVWEATLPDRRVFHVSDLTEVPQTPRITNSTKRNEQLFSFHIRHAPPIAHGICHESRAVVLSRGFLLSGSKTCTGKPSAGPWFNPQRDMLYLDRNMRHCLKAKTPINVHGLNRVLHVGLEWRAWFRDVPRLPDGENMHHQQWKMAMEPLLLHCPSAETMSFVLPRVRHAGGVPSGREPYGAEKYSCSLETLPEGTKVPWERMPVQVTNGALVNFPGTALSQLGGESMPVEWRVICRQMKTAADLLPGDGTRNVEDEGFHEPVTQRRRIISVRGWWLVRPGARIGQEEQEAQEFWE